MKKLLTFFVMLLMTVAAWAQNPKLSYQAVVRDNSNKLVTNSHVDVTICVLLTDNSLQYTQSFAAVPTNQNGLFSLLIGGEANWDDINWLHSKIAVVITLPDLSVVKDTTEVNAVPLAINARHSATVDPSALVQSNWIQEDTEDPSFIQNKPSISDTVNTILTTEGYVTVTALDGRHYLTSDSAVIITMQSNISKNADGIDNLILHTAKAAIRDSVAGQIHDSIVNIAANAHTHGNKDLLDTYTQTEDNLADAVAKKHEHANAEILNNTTATYTNADSTKLDGIEAGAEVNVQADWNQTTTTADDYIKNKPSIKDTVNGILTTEGYVTATALDARHYLTSDSAVIGNMRGDITTNANSIADLTLHTAKAAIRDSVAGQIHDSIVNIADKAHTHENKALLDTYNQTNTDLTDAVAKKHEHANAEILNNTTATYTNADSTKLDGIEAGAEVNVQSDWKQTDNAKDDYIKNKPSISDTVNTILTTEGYVTATALDGRHYLISDSAVIITMQGNISTNANNITSLQGNLSAAISKEKTDSTTLAGRIDALENASMDCNDVKNCIKDTLSKYTPTADLCDVLSSCQISGKSLADLLQGLTDRLDAQEAKIDSLAHLVDSLAKLPHGGGETAIVDTVFCYPNLGANTPDTNTVTRGQNFDLSSVTFTHPVETNNWEIASWNTKADGSGTRYERDATITNIEGNLTLYAQWHTWCTDTSTANEVGTDNRIDSVKDVDNNKYAVVKIGNQCWMAQNLRTKLGTDGDKGYPTSAGADSLLYGRLYTWNAVTKGASTNYTAGGTNDTIVHGICPEGWHVPSDAEWDTLTTYVKSKDEYICDEGANSIANALADTTGWSSNTSSGCNAGNTGGKANLTGFSAVPAGGCFPGDFDFFGYYAIFWSATQSDGYNAWSRNLDSSDSTDYRYYDLKDYGFSVRCLRDAEAGGGDTPGGGETAIVDTVFCYPNLGANTPAMNTVTRDENFNLSTVSFSHPVETNWEVASWNTKADGSGTRYERDATITTTSNLTLYAQWRTFCTGTPSSANEVGSGRIDSLKDVENNKYAVVQIGNQCWMKENLRTSNVNGKGAVYTNNAEGYDVNIYGRLYDWAAVMQVEGANDSEISVNSPHHRGICPEGWHVPSNAEWDTLTTYVNIEVNGYRCDGDGTIANALSSTTGWSSNTSSGCNAGNTGDKSNLTGFSAVPAGGWFGGWFDSFGDGTFFWSATEDGDDNAWCRELFGYVSVVARYYDDKANGYPVRCLRDADNGGGDTPDTPGGETVAVTFQPNGAMGTMESQTVTSGVSTPLNANVFNRTTAPETDRNWEFIGWNTKADGTGDSYADKADVTFDSDTTLYAQWRTWCTGTPNTTENEFGGSNRIDSLKDSEGNKYAVVQIGNQCWMKENLRTKVGEVADGDYGYPTEAGNDTVIYGRLYTWDAVTKGASTTYPQNATDTLVHGICPAGWHVPSAAEWNTLTTYVKGKTDYQCGGSANNIANALSAATGWSSPVECCAGHGSATLNKTGFSAVPAGYFSNGSFNGFGGDAYFCSATEDNSSEIMCLYLHRFDYYGGWSFDYKDATNSVRCLRDAGIGGGDTPDTPDTPGGGETTIVDTVTCYPNLGANESVKKTVTRGQNIDLSTTFTHPVETNWEIAGWNTSADGTGTSYTNTFTTNGNLTLYAQWRTFCTVAGVNSNSEIGTTNRIDSLKDSEGNKYTVVQIGNQCWMKENLRTSNVNGKGNFYNPGTGDNTANEVNVLAYGRLYNWAAVMQGASSTNYPKSGNKVQGICPAGWHVPSDAEWDTLTYYVYNSTAPGYKCSGCTSMGWTQSTECIAKALSSTTGWSSNNSSGCNAGNTGDKSNLTGFSAVPAGYVDSYNHFYDLGSNAYFWSATQYYSSSANLRNLFSSGSYVYRTYGFNTAKYSVRCLRDTCIRGGDIPDTPDTPGGGETVAVTFQPNGAMGTMESQTVTSGVSTPLNANVFNRTTAPETDRNWEFIGWNTKADGTGDSYADKADVTFDSDTTLYAQWRTWCTGTPNTTVNEFGGSNRIDSLKDSEGNKYAVVQIGNQCWMKENLRTITGVTVGTNCWHAGNNADNDETYGLLYNWAAVMQGKSTTNYPVSGDKVRGICPEGWHVPSDTEWTVLTDYVKGKSEYQCNSTANNIAKALASTTGWSNNETACNVGNAQEDNNATGFSAVPAGRCVVGYFHFFGYYAYFWSATQNDGNDAWYRSLDSYDSYVYRSYDNKDYGFSVRCLRDAGIGGGDTPDTPGGGETAIVDTVTCYSNLGSKYSVKKTVTRGESFSLSTVKFAHLVETNWEIASWNTSADGSGTRYERNATITTSDNLTLYAQWRTFCIGTPSSANEVGSGRIDSLKDVENNKYAVVQIGNQCWMKENLRTNVGDGVYPKKNYGQDELSEDEKVTYGRLYTWTAMMNGKNSSNAVPSGVQGICPTGWHVPSDAEWTALTVYVKSKSEYQCGDNAENIANALSAQGWPEPIECCAGHNSTTLNKTGFSAVPAGECYDFGEFGVYFSAFGADASFWSATQSNSDYAYSRTLDSDNPKVLYYPDEKIYGYSVRCLRD